MKIASGTEIVGKALFFPEKGILAIADLHIGYEGMLNEKGVMVPRVQFKEMMDDLKKVLDEIEKSNGKIKEVVILGDLKHDFKRISMQEWKDVSSILDFLKKHAEKIIIARGRDIELKDFYIREDICFVHGHRMFAECLDRKIKTIVMGHRHPALVLKDKTKSEGYKCFLSGKWKGRQVIIMPSFFPLVEGTDISADFENKLAFNLNLKNFKVYAVGDKVYGFGVLKRLKKIA